MPSPSKDREWQLRTYRPGDETGIVRLFERGFGRRLDERAWRWKFKERASPVDNVWLAVDESERPIFHYGGIARRLTFAGEERDVMVAVDSVTDPDRRRQGILTAGGGAAHRAWAAAGVACVLGQPNEQWGSRVEAFGWRPLFPLRWAIRPLRPEGLLAKRLGLAAVGRLAVLGRLWNAFWDRRADPAIEIREVERTAQLDAFWEARGAGEGPRHQPILVRDREWLEWRYLACPVHRYRVIAAVRAGEIAGYAVYRFDDASRHGFLAELLTRPGDSGAGRALVTAAVGHLDRLGAVAAAALAAPGTDLHQTLRRAGFLFSWGSFVVHCVPLVDDLPLAALRDPRRFELQGGDFDAI